MSKRSKMSRKANHKLFRKGCKTDTKNFAPPPLRGGYRM